MSDDEERCGLEDVAFIGPADEHGRAMVVRHTADHRDEVGMVRKPKDGEVISPGERVIDVTPRRDGLYDVVDHGHAGPAMVNSKAYRDGWDSIFGSKQTTGEA